MGRYDTHYLLASTVLIWHLKNIVPFNNLSFVLCSFFITPTVRSVVCTNNSQSFQIIWSENALSLRVRLIRRMDTGKRNYSSHVAKWRRQICTNNSQPVKIIWSEDALGVCIRLKTFHKSRMYWDRGNLNTSHVAKQRVCLLARVAVITCDHAALVKVKVASTGTAQFHSEARQSDPFANDDGKLVPVKYHVLGTETVWNTPRQWRQHRMVAGLSHACLLLPFLVQ